MTAVLGISAYYHDSAAALVVDGEIGTAARRERVSLSEGAERFPKHATDYRLAEGGLAQEDVDRVGFYDAPLLKFDRLLETYLAFAPSGFRSFLRAIPLWLREKLHLPREMRKALRGRYSKRFVFTEHHESHAASAFFPSPFEEAAILTVDGVGEWATASYGVGRGNHVRLSRELRFPHSLGLLYSAFTFYCGFRVNSGEYKLMGLAPYGEPRYVDLILEHLLDLKADGSFRMDLSYFNYCQGLTMTSRKFDALFGAPARDPVTALDQRHMDVAASIQKVAEEILLRTARHVHRETGMKALCLAGGVALNCVANGRILREGPFDDVWIQPAAGDAGGALGVALFIWHQLLDKPRTVGRRDGQAGSLLGPCYGDEEVIEFLDGIGARFERIADEKILLDRVVDLIASEKVVGWMQGRMEFGPRALGSRSILGDARSETMASTMNLKIKFRESFRPFAPSIPRERVSDYFGMRVSEDSPHMLRVAPVQEERRVEVGAPAIEKTGFERLGVKRSEIPAVTHVDCSARVQTVDPERNRRYHALLKRFEAATGCPVLINTSFNVRGEPIVRTPADAYHCFMATDIDALVIENVLLLKEEQPRVEGFDRQEHLSRFEPD